MSDKDEDLDVDARLHDGWQLRVHFKDGTHEYFRDRDNLASVRARVLAGCTSADPAAVVDFSGAREAEGLTEEGAPILGPLRGKGFAEAKAIKAVAYSSSDGTEASAAAYEAATALLDVQRAALAALQEQAGIGGQQQPEGAAADGSEDLLGRGST